MNDFITQESEKFIQNFFNEKGRKNLKYHDIAHTEYVAKQAKFIGEKSGLTDEALSIVIVAAWFHDSGFMLSSRDHEEESKKIAREFLTTQKVPEEFINKVIFCIEATKMPQNQGDDLLAQVVCDADMSYLSEDFYLDRTALLRKEWNSESDTKLSRKTYYEETVDLFNNHRYYTDFGEKEFSAGKAKNFQLLHTLREKKPKKGKKKASILQSENKKLLNKLEK